MLGYSRERIRELKEKGMIDIENGKVVPKTKGDLEEYLSSTYLYSPALMLELWSRYRKPFGLVAEIFNIDDFLRLESDEK